MGNLEATNYVQLGVSPVKYLALAMNRWNMAFQRERQIKYNPTQNPIFFKKSDIDHIRYQEQMGRGKKRELG